MSTYSATVLEHFYKPRNAFRLEGADRIGTSGTPGSGPFLVLYLKVEGERIQHASFQCHGCGAVIAAGSLLVERLEGVSLEEAAGWDAARLTDALGGLPPGREHAPALAVGALGKALGSSGLRKNTNNEVKE